MFDRPRPPIPESVKKDTSEPKTQNKNVIALPAKMEPNVKDKPEKERPKERAEATSAQAGKDAEKDKQEKIEKRHFELFLESLKKLASALRERDEKRLNALLPPESVGQIARGARTIEDLLSAKKTDAGSVKSEIAKVTMAVEMIGSVRQHGAIREDTDNLGRTRYCLGQVEEGSRAAMFGCLRSSSEDVKTIAGALEHLFDTVQKKRSYIARLADAFSGYRR